jgi:predicted enzyme related to lactoylglutathione lyase
MAEARTYPHGVPCWVDTDQPDLTRAARFYGGLFDWSFEDARPGEYVIATLARQDVAAIGAGGDSASGWNTYIAVDNADASAAAVVAAGGRVLEPPQDAGPGGSTATCADPSGARFHLWQPYRRLGAQRVNAPGSWNFSILRTPDSSAALSFYSAVFGWEGSGDESAMSLRVPGYGDHLARTVDPGIHDRQASAPPGFADVIGGMESTTEGEAPHWQVKFTVDDRDTSVARAEQLGGTVVSTSETPWSREAVIRDDAGAEFSLSQFTLAG